MPNDIGSTERAAGLTIFVLLDVDWLGSACFNSAPLSWKPTFADDNPYFGVRSGVAGFCFDETTMGEMANTDEGVCGQGGQLRRAAYKLTRQVMNIYILNMAKQIHARERRTLCWLGMRIESTVPVAAVGSFGKMAKLLPLM